jgi:hypothetical protein
VLIPRPLGCFPILLFLNLRALLLGEFVLMAFFHLFLFFDQLHFAVVLAERVLALIGVAVDGGRLALFLAHCVD